MTERTLASLLRKARFYVARQDRSPIGETLLRMQIDEALREFERSRAKAQALGFDGVNDSISIYGVQLASENSQPIPGYMTIAAAAERWHRSAHTIRRWCNMATGRIPGAVKAGKTWLIPLGTVMPKPPRGAASHKKGS